MPTTAEILAERLKGDNRSVIGSVNPMNPNTDFVATDLGEVGANHGLTYPISATSVAFSASVTRDKGQILVMEGGGGLSKKDLRTQYFSTGDCDVTKVGFGAKRCFVNAKGQPLAADGTPTTVALAVDAETTDLSSNNSNQALTSWAQVHGPNRTPVPGYHDAWSRATSLYAPYAAWTAQDLPQP